MPISRNNVVQTGPKTQFGGAKLGLTSVVYHVGIELKENTEPKIPAICGIIIAIKNVNIVFNFMAILYHPFTFQ